MLLTAPYFFIYKRIFLKTKKIVIVKGNGNLRPITEDLTFENKCQLIHLHIESSLRFKSHLHRILFRESYIYFKNPIIRFL